MKKFYNLVKQENKLELYLYGEICSEKWSDSDVTASGLIEQIKNADVSEIDVYISSYGGEVQAGLAIYNALRRHKAKIKAIVDGFACSVASVIFMAGDERIMNEASLLMIHNAWTFASGNAEELRKQADDLEKITQASVEAYKSHSSLTEEEIKALMDKETWLLPEECLEYGFATSIDKAETKNASQNAFKQLMNIITAYQEENNTDDEGETPETTDEPETDEPNNEPETTDEPNKDDEGETGDTGEEPETNNEGDEGEEPDEPNNDDGEDSTQQLMCGFFNAISKI